MAVAAAEVRGDVTSLGTVEFTFDQVSSVLHQAISIEAFKVLDPINHLLLRSVIAEMEQALSQRFMAEIHIANGMVSPGSLKFEKGQIVITSPRLAVIICALTVVMHYDDLRTNVIQIYKDVSAIVHAIPHPPEVSGIIFKPADPDHVIADLEPFLPSNVREIVRKRRS